MNLPSAVYEIYLTAFALLMIGSLCVGRFRLRPKAKLQLCRVLFAASVFSPLLIRVTKPAEKPLMPRFVSLDGWEPVSRTFSPTAKPNEFRHPTSQPISLTVEDFQAAIFFVWLMGVGLGIGAFIRDLSRVRSVLRRACLYRSVGRLRIKISDQCQIPFSIRGIACSYVVVPMSIVHDSQQMKIAIAHEGQHHRQGDCLFAYFFELVGILFFWNPGIRRWKRVFGELQEFSCDEALVGHRLVSPHDYGRCLFKVAQTVLSNPESWQRNFACAVGMAKGVDVNQQSVLRRRISMLSEYQSVVPKRVLFRSLLTGLSVVIPVCAAYAARGSMTDSSENKLDTSTLAPEIQSIADREIESAVKRLNARSGAIAVADAKSGRILAFAEKRADQSLESWATRSFAPGSTIKPFVAAAAIETGVANEGKKYDCRHPYVVGGEQFKNHATFTDVTVTDAIAQSVNVCLIKMAQETGSQQVRDTLNRFGFSADRNPNDGGDEALELAQLAVGETLPVSFATMTKAYSILANDGTDPNRKAVVSGATAESVQRMLVAAVNGGTAKNAALPGYVVAGKTGTVSAGGDVRPLALFGGYVPTKNSELVAFVLIEDGHRANSREPGYGGTLAAPVFHDVMKKSLETLK